MDNDLLLVGEAKSVLTNKCDSEGDAVHGLFPARPVNKFILSLQGIDSKPDELYRGDICSGSITLKDK